MKQASSSRPGLRSDATRGRGRGRGLGSHSQLPTYDKATVYEGKDQAEQISIQIDNQ